MNLHNSSIVSQIIHIYRDISDNGYTPEPFLNFIETTNDQQSKYLFVVADSIGFIKNNFAFGIDAPGNIIRIFKTTSTNSSFDTFKKIVEEILQDRYRFESGGTITDTLANTLEKTSIIDIPLGTGYTGGLIPGINLPLWLENLLGVFGLNVNTPWHLWAILAAGAGYKLSQKDSNKIIWGALFALCSWVLVRRFLLKPKSE